MLRFKEEEEEKGTCTSLCVPLIFSMCTPLVNTVTSFYKKKNMDLRLNLNWPLFHHCDDKRAQIYPNCIRTFRLYCKAFFVCGQNNGKAWLWIQNQNSVACHLDLKLLLLLW